MIKKLPVQLLLCTLIAIMITDFLPMDAIRFFFSLSCALKSILMAALPLMIFTFISCAILSLEHKAFILLISLIGMVTVSNATALLVTYGVGSTLLPLITLSPESVLTKAQAVTPLFTCPIPQLLSPDKALFAGIIFGLIFTFFPSARVTNRIFSVRSWVNIGLKRGFIPLLPLYIFGFILKLQAEGAVGGLVTNFGQVFILICLLIVCYISFLYFIGNGLDLKKTRQAIGNMLPAAITGFSTLSSAATMPVTLAGTEKNTQDPQFAHLVIPTSVNNHLLGSTIGITMLGLTSMIVLGYDLPSLSTYLVFITYFCLAALSAAGVPGGCIIVLLPVMERHLGLTSEMGTLVTAIYLLMEPFFTSGNVTGNGAFALIAQRVCRKFELIKVPVAE